MYGCWAAAALFESQRDHKKASRYSFRGFFNFYDAGRSIQFLLYGSRVAAGLPRPGQFEYERDR